MAVLDLDYAEDSNAQADANFVMTGTSGIVEIQGTAEQTPFSESQFQELLNLARKGITSLSALQRQVKHSSSHSQRNRRHRSQHLDVPRDVSE